MIKLKLEEKKLKKKIKKNFFFKKLFKLKQKKIIKLLKLEKLKKKQKEQNLQWIYEQTRYFLNRQSYKNFNKNYPQHINIEINYKLFIISILSIKFPYFGNFNKILNPVN